MALVIINAILLLVTGVLGIMAIVINFSGPGEPRL
jgi:hypothetical protein